MALESIHEQINLMFVNPTRHLWWSFSEKFIRLFAGTILTLLIAKQIGPAEFGLFSTVFAIFMLFTAIGSVGLKDIVIDEIASARYNIEHIVNSAAGIMFIVGGILTLIFVGIAAIIYPVFGSEFWVAMILSMLIALKGFDTILYVFESKAQLKIGAIIQQIAILSSALAKLMLLYFGASAILLAVVTVIEFIALYITAIIFAKRQKIIISVQKFRWDVSKRLIKRSWPMTAAAISVIGYYYIDQIMIAIFLDDASVGIYATASRISQQLYIIPTILVSAYYPRLTNMYAKSDKDFINGFEALTKILIIISLLVCVTVFLLDNLAISFLLGQDFYMTAQVLTIHVFALIFVSINIISDRWYIMHDLQRLSMIRHIITLGINFSLNILLIPILGVIGAAYATLFSTFCLSFCLDYISREGRELINIKIKIFKSLFKPKTIIEAANILRRL